LNLACQAAIEVYDPLRKKKTIRTRLTDIEHFSDFSGSEDSHDEEDSDYKEDDEYAEELSDVMNRSNAILNVIH
jgi:hypothetical protein